MNVQSKRKEEDAIDAVDKKDIFQEYGQLVYRYLLGLCGEKELAEELMQETFYQAIKSISRYDGSCKLSTWLCQIAKHMWYQQLRKRKREADCPQGENGIATERSAEEQAVQKFEVMELLKKVHTLPEKEKEVVLLRATGSLSFREIGEIMEKTENWARVTFFRAKQKLKEGNDDE